MMYCVLAIIAAAGPSDMSASSVKIARTPTFCAASTGAPIYEVKCHPGGPEKQMMDLGLVCADLSGGATDKCDGACRTYWDANYTKCLEPFWQFIPAPFRPPFDGVKEVCLAATAGSCFSKRRGVVLRTTSRMRRLYRVCFVCDPCYGAVSSNHPPVSTAVPTQLQVSVFFGGFF